MKKKRVGLRVAYNGTNYHGWQIQENGITVEAVLNQALSALCGEEIHVIGASRTDAGVHALGNVAVFDTTSRIPAEKFSYALNQRLPDDIKVQASFPTARDFHPRKCYSEKTYRYQILNSSFPLPQLQAFTYFVHVPLVETRMDTAARALLGEHDFRSFCSVQTQAVDFVREILSCAVTREGALVTLSITGTGFLYNMVRIIAGTLVEVGMGKRKPEEMEEILEARDRAMAGPTAPPQGLTLVKIEYPQGMGGDQADEIEIGCL